jgi:2-dehydropantoate 2-reductase
MKIGVIGAGAIGGWMAAKLALAGEAVSVLARGETLATIQARGITLIEGSNALSASVRASSNVHELGVQDVVIVSVKAPSLAEVASQISPMLGAETIVLSAMNGVPTWFFSREDRPLCGMKLLTIDRDGAIGKVISPERTIGCVVHASCSVDAPGVVRHKMGNKLIIGEARGSTTARLNKLAATLSNARFEAIISDDIQKDIWFKLWGNMTMNPISAITGATGDKILDDNLVRAFCSRVMREAQAIGAKIGVEIADSPEDRHAVTRKLGAFKTSMLQDVESRRAVELDALVSAVREIGEHVSVATPNIDAMLGLARLHARVRDLYPKE